MSRSPSTFKVSATWRAIVEPDDHVQVVDGDLSIGERALGRVSPPHPSLLTTTARGPRTVGQSHKGYRRWVRWYKPTAHDRSRCLRLRQTKSHQFAQPYVLLNPRLCVPTPLAEPAWERCLSLHEGSLGLAPLVPQPRHRTPVRAVSPGQRALTASFATRRSGVQISPAPRNALVRAFSCRPQARSIHDL